MFRNKLITIAAIAGVLVSGACGISDYKTPPQPPPVLKLDLQGIHSIAVSVINKSPSQNLETTGFAAHLATDVNIRFHDARIKGYVAREGKLRDADLQVILKEEHAELIPFPGQGDGLTWDIRVRLSAKLVTRNGRQIWHQTDASYHVAHIVVPGEPANPASDIWSNRFVYIWAPGALSQKLVNEIYSEDPK